MDRTTNKFLKAYDLVTIGMRAAYLESAGHIRLPFGLDGEEELTEFALKLSKGFKKFQEEDEFGNWDDYIENALIEEYNPIKMRERGVW